MSTRSFKRAHARRLDRELRRAAGLRRKGARVAGLALTAGALFAANAEAATYTVTTTGDDASGGSCTAGSCTTLRDALTVANADTTADTIEFAAGVHGTITLSHGALPISGTGGLTITGPGANTLAVSGNNASQVFDIATPRETGVSVAINDLTITKGKASSANPGGAIESEDGSDAAAALLLTGDTISDSTTAETTPDDGGGGVWVKGALTITDSTLTGNTAPGADGGAIDAAFAISEPVKYSLNVIDTTISGNTAMSGGGIAGSNNVTISGNSQITGNHATSVMTDDDEDGVGGGIYGNDTSLKLSDSKISENTATFGGGGIGSDSKYGTTITGSTISGNTSVHGGGLAFNAYYDSYSQGFAKYNPVNVDNSTISGNTATDGAGIDVMDASPGSSIKIDASTVSGNTGGPSSFGGGLLLAAYIFAPVRVIDSTISGNTATDGGGASLSYGGSTHVLIGQGHNAGQGSIAFENSTIAGNVATGAGGGLYLAAYSTGTPPAAKDGTATLNSTIVAGNTAAGKANDLARSASATTGGFDTAFSLVETPGTAPLLSAQSLITGKNPQLGPLAANGGPTETMLPAGTSPAIDQGHGPKNLPTDQRGDPRTVDTAIPNPPGGDGTDIGSVELPASAVVVPTAGFSASLRGAKLGSGSPLLVGNSTPVDCAVKLGTLGSCVIEVRVKGKLVATGEATTPGAHKSLSTKVIPTATGISKLAHAPLGLAATAKVVGQTSQSGSQTIAGKVQLLAGPSITLPISMNSPKLSKALLKQLKQVAKLLKGAKSITCTAYSHGGKGDTKLTKSEANTACMALSKDGFKGKVKSAGKVHASGNRIVVTFKF